MLKFYYFSNFINCLNFAILIISLTATCCYALDKPDPKVEADTIAACLERFGGLTPENAERLQRYTQWSDTYEEIPCFTNCYLNKMYDFYNESIGFIETNIVRQFGETLYSACRDRMTNGRDKCQQAYNGFHCIASLENDPFILIESMERLNSEAKTAMKDCLRKFDQYEWSRLNEYSNFPVSEPIPCFTKCFLDKLQLFREHTKQWHIEGMQKKLGVPRGTEETYRHCRELRRRRRRNVCAWMYQEFTCYVMAK